MEIREATAIDSNQIEALYKELVIDPEVKVTQSRVEQIKADSNNFLFIAEIDGEVSGTCFLTICLDPMYGKQPFAVVENIVVSSRSRGEGIGTSLLKYIESLCLEKGCSKMMLQSSIDRKEAHRFFKFLGYDQDKKAGFVKYRQNFISN